MTSVAQHGADETAQGRRSAGVREWVEVVAASIVVCVVYSLSFLKPLHVDADWPALKAAALAPASLPYASYGLCYPINCGVSALDTLLYNNHPIPYVFLTRMLADAGFDYAFLAHASNVVGAVFYYLGSVLLIREVAPHAARFALVPLASPIVLATFMNGSVDAIFNGLSLIGAGLSVVAFRRRVIGLALFAGVVVGAAWLIRYRAFVPLAIAGFVMLSGRRGRREAVIFLAASASMLVGFQAGYIAVAEWPHPYASVVNFRNIPGSVSRRTGGMFERVAAVFPSVGGALFSPLAAPAFLIERFDARALVAALGGALVTVVFAWLQGDPTTSLVVSALLGACGALVLLGATRMGRLVRDEVAEDEEAVFEKRVVRAYTLTLVATGVLLLALTNFVTARYFIDLMPIGVALLARYASRHGDAARAWLRRPAALLLATLLAGVPVAVADYEFARAGAEVVAYAREQARALGPQTTIWFSHEWGLRYELERTSGLRFLGGEENLYYQRENFLPVVMRVERPRRGDMLLVTENHSVAWSTSRCTVDAATRREVFSGFPLRVMNFWDGAGLYSGGWGAAPYTLTLHPRATPIERVGLCRMNAGAE